ncbi:unnamed protein product [Bursaphelenchus okinawaensis]|uniref:GPI ethanolamine phosphate transferase 2 C-terminal domain-containing protein n=1 Tax=Bursaphelenchus okinawaensis TaxID=465554 RepID=A0A811KB44_9BILA|nr:unnamed protein product [Bursaphelenchus okinawaensis]CAG9095194.1 unnamed protein product [Bursaphelenchus okinawaensis]
MALFGISFFQQKKSLTPEDGHCHNRNIRVEDRKRLVLVVIDAFAYEFVDEHPEELKFLMNGKGILVKGHVQAPTVTLPRVKMSNMRATVIKLHNEGKSNPEIAKLLNISRMTVYRSVKRFEELGHDRDRPRTGRPAYVNTVANRQMIKKRFKRNPRTPVRKMARETGIKESTLRYIVRKKLMMKPYKLKKVQKLTEENKAAIVSGTVPTYLDVIFNYATLEFAEDNWVKRGKDSGYRTVFYGDDTWLKMFPNVFERSEGTVSFYVTDYTEVDNNVTRHLDYELNNLDKWDILVLHYLGLDHIGHSLGGRADKVKEKLREMDGVVERIYRSLEGHGDFNLVVMGDHGMTETGGHGGGDPRESNVAIFVKGNDIDTNVMDKKGKLVEQVDIVPTIASYLNLCIPVNNLGISFTLSFKEVGQSSITMMKDNILQFKTLFSENKEVENLDIYCTANESFEKCNVLLKNMQFDALSSLQHINYNRIFFSLGLLAFLFLMCLYEYEAKSNQGALINLVFAGLPCVLWTSSSFIEEEHDVLNYIVPTVVMLSWYLNKTDSMYSFVIMVLQRVVRLPFEHKRRRWLMEKVEGLDSWGNWYYAILVPLLMVLVVKNTKMRLRNFVNIKSAKCTGILLYLGLIKHGVLNTFGYPQILIIVMFYLSDIRCGLTMWYLFICGPQDSVVVVICQLLGSCISDMKRKLESLYVLIIMASFFYTGNSESLSSVDINVGYAGLKDYSMLIVGFQIFLKLYLGPINIVMGSSAAQRSLFISLMTFSRLACALMSTMMVFWQRNHLFVWSVFAPKMVFEFVHLLLFFVFCVIKNLLKF